MRHGRGGLQRLCGKQSCWAEGITARMIPENADHRSHFAPAMRRNRELILLHPNANLGHKRTKNFHSYHGNERAIKEEDQALRPWLCEESYVPKLTDGYKAELTISFATDPRSCAAQQKPLSGCELVLETWVLSHLSAPRGSTTNGNGNDQTSKVDARSDRTCWAKTSPLLALESSRKSSFAARDLMSTSRTPHSGLADPSHWRVSQLSDEPATILRPEWDPTATSPRRADTQRTQVQPPDLQATNGNPSLSFGNKKQAMGRYLPRSDRSLQSPASCSALECEWGMVLAKHSIE